MVTSDEDKEEFITSTILKEEVMYGDDAIPLLQRMYKVQISLIRGSQYDEGVYNISVRSCGPESFPR